MIILGAAFELSSMGIRQMRIPSKRQVAITGDQDRLELKWHRALLNGLFPTNYRRWDRSIADGYVLISVRNIGEVQTSVWPQEAREQYEISYKIVSRSERNRALHDAGPIFMGLE